MATQTSESFAWSANIADYGSYGMLANDLGGSSIGAGGPLGDPYGIFDRTGGNPTYAVARLLPAQIGTFFCGFRYFPQTSNPLQAVDFADTGPVSEGYLTGYTQFFIVFDTATGTVRAYRGSPGGSPNAMVLLGASGPGVFPLANWFFAEIGGVISATVGSIAVRVNGATVLSLTGIDTYGSSGQVGASPTIGAINWCGASTTANNGPDCFVQHLYVNDNTGAAPNSGFLGDVRVQYVSPTANGVVAFTPVGKLANWENAGTIPPVPATDYNSDSTLDAQDTFAMAPPAAGLTTIYAVVVKGLYSVSSAGDRDMANIIVSSGTTGIGANVALGTSPAMTETAFDTDPATGVAWTVGGVQAATPGYRITV